MATPALIRARFKEPGREHPCACPPAGVPPFFRALRRSSRRSSRSREQQQQQQQHQEQ